MSGQDPWIIVPTHSLRLSAERKAHLRGTQLRFSITNLTLLMVIAPAIGHKRAEALNAEKLVHVYWYTTNDTLQHSALSPQQMIEENKILRKGERRLNVSMYQYALSPHHLQGRHQPAGVKVYCQVTETTKRKCQTYLVELRKTFSNNSYGLCQVFLLDDKWGCKSNANPARQQ